MQERIEKKVFCLGGAELPDTGKTGASAGTPTKAPGAYAGLARQYIFYYTRSGGAKTNA